MEKDFLFYNIVPFAPGREKRTAQDMIDYRTRTGNDIVLYSLSLHPEGFPATEKADFLIASYRELKRELAGSGVRLGVLIQSILGHWPRVDKTEESWTRTVNIDGETPRFCPLDPDFRAYITYVAKELAGEKPCFIMGDDDIRGFSPKAECFCPLHTAEFNRRTGMDLTADALREAVRASRPGDRIFNTFLQLQRDTVNGVASLIRQAVDSVDPSIPAGSCMPGWEFRFNDQTSRAFAARGQAPVMRVCNADYLEQDIKKAFPRVLTRSLALRAAHPGIPNVLDEADTFPHDLYSRASVSMHAKLCTSIMAGMNGAKIWFVNAHKGEFPVSRNYTATLEKYQHFYQELTRSVKGTVWRGLVQPIHKNFPGWHFTTPYNFFLEDQNWADTMCAVFGIPFYCAMELNGSGVYLLAGEKAVARFSDEELKQLLSGKLLVDGPAAAALTSRGFAQYLGASAEMEDFRFNREYDADGRSLVMGKNDHVPKITVTDADAEVLTSYFYSPFVGSSELEKVAPATVFMKNTLGGHICTTGFHMDVVAHQIHNAGRKAWLLTVLEKLTGGKLPFAVANEQNFAVLTRENSAGETILAACNLNFEPVENLAVRCAVRPEKLQVLTPAGEWEEMPFEWQENGVAVLPLRMACYALAVLRIR